MSWLAKVSDGSYTKMGTETMGEWDGFRSGNAAHAVECEASHPRAKARLI